MENQKPHDLQTGTHVVLSESLLKASYAGSSRDDEDFRQQNEIISQELRKYDKQLNSCPMRIYKAWTLIWVTFLSLFLLTIIGSLFIIFKNSANFDLEFCAFMVVQLPVTCTSICTYILLWRALHSKDPFKVEKCIYIFKFLLVLSIIFWIFDLAWNIFRKSFTWERALGNLLAPIISMIDFGTAMFVKKVLLQRDVFQQVSSYSKSKK